MGAVDDAIDTIQRAHSGTGEATTIVYRAIQACERFAGMLTAVGLDKPAAILLATRATLQDEVHVGLAVTDGNAGKALESLAAAKGSDDLDRVSGALAAGQSQLSDMRGTATAAVGRLDEASALVTRIGSKSKNLVGMLAQARQKLEEVAQHGAVAAAATDTTTGAVAGDRDFS